MIKEEAWAKLNLNLHLLPKKLPNGFYPVKFINCQLDLHDELLFFSQQKKIEIICDHPEIPEEKVNLIYKAALLIKEIVNNDNLGAKIVLQKNIPIKAGLGGGSSDAAAAIQGLRKLWKIELTNQQLFYLADTLGKDVFYCLKGGVCEISGDGSLVKKLFSRMPTLWLIIIVPKENKPSTEFMYKNLDPKKIGGNLDTLEKLLIAIKSKNKHGIINNLFNEFDFLAQERFPVLKKIQSDLQRAGALNTMIDGAGLAVCGFFDSKARMVQSAGKLLNDYQQIMYAKTK